ncbi:myb-like dna-binding [Plasmopara halstedii]|uniref:Myb-like dna-binding n=1 Tax=Plasmopara halstedii TaxID=4781 RepID=A0A0P1A502_PLAHL|nr:myb-like dna-binding [Plasmopara halstedii]CEG35383.1 myb-like dna-binding [Plasmopara halstedii]|eukprot:XP_024571752.1 myb-like dna-binding [Plasmopara halstedii]
MTISRNVYNQLFEQAPDTTDGAAKEKVIRLRPTEAKAGAVVMSAKNKIQMWTKEEHERFLAALEKFPAGPWKKVADFIGTKTPRQTMTHAQKYRQKIHRRQRGLRNQKKPSTNSVTLTSDPVPVDINTEPQTIVSPYSVTDLQVKINAEAVAAAAAAAGVTNDQLLNILAQQATTMNQEKQDYLQIEASVTADSLTMPDAAASHGSPSNNHLPSLAQILHLGSAEGQTMTPSQDKTETTETNTEFKTVETDLRVEDQSVVIRTTATTETEAETQIQQEGNFSTHSCEGYENDETTAQPRQLEII